MSRPQSQDISIAPTTVAEEQTRQRVTRDFGLTAEGAACLRVDVYVGEVVDTNAISFGLETSSGLGIWTDTKSVEVPANDTAEVEAATYLQYAQSLAQSDYQLVDEYWLAEQFVASTSGTLASAVMQLSNPDATTGGVIVQLRADDEGEPGALIAESSEIDLADVTSSWVEYTVTFDDDAVIEAGTTYWRVFATTAGTDEVNIRCTNGGFDIVQFYTDDGGATWMEDTGSAAVTRFYMSDADAFASASHGLASGAAVVLANSGGSLPLPLTPNTI